MKYVRRTVLAVQHMLLSAASRHWDTAKSLDHDQRSTVHLFFARNVSRITQKPCNTCGRKHNAAAERVEMLDSVIGMEGIGLATTCDTQAEQNTA